MKISYLVTCGNETDTLDRLFSALLPYVWYDDEVVVLKDTTGSKDTEDIVQKYVRNPKYSMIRYFYHPLDNDYGGHKNFGIQKCEGDFIFQIDGDERPPEALMGDNIYDLLAANPDIEAYAVPRINDFRGVTEEHAKQWGWHLMTSPTYKRPIVNWPDHQWRIFKKDYPRISFTRRLHEKIEGYLKYVILPAAEEYALYHDKTIENQCHTHYTFAFTRAIFQRR